MESATARLTGPRRNKHLVAIGATVAAAVLAAAGCSSSGSGSGSSSSGGGSVTIGVTPAQITFAPVFLAQAAGYFKDEGITVKLVSLSNGTTELAALLGGDVDVIAGSGGTFANATAKGGAMVSVLGLAQMSEEVCVMKSWAQGKGITASSSVHARLQALSGSVLGDTSAGSSSQTDFEYLLKTYGGVNPQGGVTFTSTGSPGGAEAALETGKISAFLLSPPTCESVAGSEVLVTPEQVDTFKAMINNVLFTKSSYASGNATLLGKAVTAVARAENYETANPSATAQEIKSSYPSGTVSLLTDALKTVSARVPKNGAMTESMWQATSQMLVGAGDISNPLNAAEGALWTNKYIDLSYLSSHAS
ncbi:MAG TPA: ABC transporter substrate-binding protein [Actinocrinis sp.]